MRVGKGNARVVIHSSCYQRTSRAQLLERLVVGGCVGEALAVEHVICVEEERAHAQRVFGAPFEPVGIVLALCTDVGLAGTVAVDAQVHTVAATCGTDGERLAVAAYDGTRESESVAAITRPRAYADRGAAVRDGAPHCTIGEVAVGSFHVEVGVVDVRAQLC